MEIFPKICFPSDNFSDFFPQCQFVNYYFSQVQLSIDHFSQLKFTIDYFSQLQFTIAFFLKDNLPQVTISLFINRFVFKDNLCIKVCKNIFPHKWFFRGQFSGFQVFRFLGFQVFRFSGFQVFIFLIYTASIIKILIRFS